MWRCLAAVSPRGVLEWQRQAAAGSGGTEPSLLPGDASAAGRPGARRGAPRAPSPAGCVRSPSGRQQLPGWKGLPGGAGTGRCSQCPSQSSDSLSRAVTCALHTRGAAASAGTWEGEMEVNIPDGPKAPQSSLCLQPLTLCPYLVINSRAGPELGLSFGVPLSTADPLLGSWELQTGSESLPLPAAAPESLGKCWLFSSGSAIMVCVGQSLSLDCFKCRMGSVRVPWVPLDLADLLKHFWETRQ